MANSSALLSPFRVGLVVIAGVVAFFVLMSFVAKRKYSDDETYKVYAVFQDATGLGAKSRVQIAGIEVGIVESVTLTADARARALLRISNDVVLKTDARIMKRSASLLGDFLLDLYPGAPDSPRLPPGSSIQNVVAQAGVEDVFAALGEVTRDIQAVTSSLKDLVASDEVGSIKEIIRSMNEVAQGLTLTITQAGGRLDNILGDIEALSSSVRTLASGQTDNVQQILGNLRLLSEQANQLVATVQGIVGTGEGELKSSVASVRDTLDALRETLEGTRALVANTDATVTAGRQIIEGIDRGEGTVGALLREDGIARRIEQTLDDVTSITKPLGKLQTHVHLREEVHWRPGAKSPSGKASFGVRLVPGDDPKFYGVGLVSEPRGKVERETVQVRGADGEMLAPVEQIIRTNDDLKFNAYIGRRFGQHAALRVGMLESSGGVGADLFALGDSLRLTVDAFDWGNPDARFPRLRASAQWTPWEHVYLGVGVDDVLNTERINRLESGTIQSGVDFFVSAGLQFDDKDLKALITMMGIPAVN